MSRAGRSIIYVELENWEQASAYFQQALNLSRKIGDYKREASTLNGLGRLSDSLGEKKLAREYFEQALMIYSAHREKRTLKGEGWTLNNLGKIDADLGFIERALDCFQKSLTIRKNILNNRWEEGRTLKNIGEVYLMLNKIPKALQCLEEALHISQKVGDRKGEGRTFNALGRSYHIVVEEAKALAYFEQALNIHRETRDHKYEARTLGDQATLLSGLPGQQSQTIENYKTALELYREIGDCWGEGTILQKLGIFYFKGNHYNVALACFILTKSIFVKIHIPIDAELEKLINNSHKELSERQFISSLTQNELEMQHIVDRALHDFGDECR